MSGHCLLDCDTAPCYDVQVPVRVIYLDRSMGAAMAGTGNDHASVNHHDFIPEAMQADPKLPKPIQPRVHVLYRPGHYDVLYPL